MTKPLTLARLDAAGIAAAAPDLGAILKDCVDGGASVSFMADLTLQRATDFWRGVAHSAEADSRVVITASDAEGFLGVVQVIPAGIDNQPHRGDVAKMLVHRRGRRQGVGEALLAAAEAAEGAVRFSFPATDPEVAALIEKIVLEKIPIKGFREEMADLETAFMTLTKGKFA